MKKFSELVYNEEEDSGPRVFVSYLSTISLKQVAIMVFYKAFSTCHNNGRIHYSTIATKSCNVHLYLFV